MSRKLLTLSVATLLMATTLQAQEVKNIIYLIGDGMGLASASMMQLENNYEATIFDHADNIALQKTYSLDNRVTDSAAAGTALATGAKTNNTMLGILPDGTTPQTLMELASEHGKATGLVVTTYIQHATPAAFYAHVRSRHEYATISEQLLHSNIDIAIGGGMAFFDERYDGRERALKAISESGYALHHNLDDDTDDDKSLFILAEKEIEHREGYLAKATAKALEHLEGDDDGFVLMVEGSIIDGAGHGNDAEGQQREMLDFMEAIEVAVEYADNNPGTLVVVTADHETGGLSLISSNADFNLSEQGIEYRWTTDGHSGIMVPIYLYGTGAELINGIVENSALGAKLKAIIAGQTPYNTTLAPTTDTLARQ